MEKKNTYKNIIIPFAFKFIIIILNIFVTRYLIEYIGTEANGLYSLYNSIIGFLSIAELGIGTAISFSMYKPIVNNNLDKVSGLYYYFIEAYRIISLVILICGLCLMPFLPYLAKDYSLDINLYYSFSLMLVSVLLSYQYSAKYSLINAHKKNYVTNIANNIGITIQYSLQILVLILTGSFILFLWCRIISYIIRWIILNIIAKKRYSQIIDNKVKCDKVTRTEVKKYIKAMFMHKIGNALVNTIDAIIISSFIGIAILGKYQCYISIMLSMTGILSLFFTPLTSTIGQMCVKESNKKKIKYFKIILIFSIVLELIFFVGYYSVINYVINICFGPDLLLSDMTVFIITINYLIQFQRNTVNLFKEASGAFYYDRWKPLLEGIINLILSLIFVRYFGIAGVILSTIATNLLICHVIEPYVLYKYTFTSSPAKYYIYNYSSMAFCIGIIILVHYCHIECSNDWLNLLFNGLISFGISSIFVAMIIIVSKDFRIFIKNRLTDVKTKLIKPKKSKI